MSKIILTQEGLDKFKTELQGVESLHFPKAETAFKEVCEVWSEGDFHYSDTKSKLDYYLFRVKFLSDVIASAVWNEAKGYYEVNEQPLT